MMMGISTCENATSAPSQDVEKGAFVKAFGAPALREPFNRKAALYLQGFIHDMPLQHKLAVGKLLKESQGKSELEVSYRKGGASESMGRWFAQNPSSMQHLPKRVRGAVCRGLWIDLDFVNCHPTLYLQLCEQKLPGIRCPHLRNYVNNRDAMLDGMVAAGVPSRAEAKQRILKVMNGGRVVDVATPWWKDMCREFRLLAKEAANHPDHAVFLENAKRREGDRNLHARTLNAVLCFIENQCLEVLFDALEQNECVPKARCSLIFDGLMIPDTPDIRKVLESEPFPGTSFLDDVGQHIEDETGYRLQVVVKEFDDAYVLPKGYENLVQDGAAIEAREALVSYLERSLLLLGPVERTLAAPILKLFRATLGKLTDESERQRVVEAGHAWLSRCIGFPAKLKWLGTHGVDSQAVNGDIENTTHPIASSFDNHTAMQSEENPKEGMEEGGVAVDTMDLDEEARVSTDAMNLDEHSRGAPDVNELHPLRDLERIFDKSNDRVGVQVFGNDDAATLVSAFPGIAAQLFGKNDAAALDSAVPAITLDENNLLHAISSIVSACQPFLAFREGVSGSIDALGALHCIDQASSAPETLLPALLSAFPDDRDRLIAEMQRRFPSLDTAICNTANTETRTADDAPYYTLRHAEVLRDMFVLQTSAPDFIRVHLPAIMGAKNVLHYSKTNDCIRFELDDWSPERYELTFADGVIWGSRRGQVCASLYEPARHYIGPGKGDRSAAEFATRVLWGRLRYDREEKAWRVFKPDPGVWQVLDGDSSHIVGRAVWAELSPLVSLEAVAGRALWGLSCFNDEEEDEEEPPPRKKSKPSPERQGFLGSVRYKYAEVHRHTKDLVSAMQTTAACSFANPTPHLLLCANGVVDLRNGQILGPAKPDQLFTSVCPTKYDPCADTVPALGFFQRFFPVEVFPDAEDIVRFLQLWFGYSITGEVMLQLAVVFKGRGSNGKTVIGRVLERVLGSEIRKTLPCASLGKPDGVNNDPLFNARKARIVTVSEIDRGSDIKEKRFKEITGEESEVFAKTMYGKEISFAPIFKTTFFVNDLPAIMENGSFAVGRRCAIVPMRVSFVNRNTEAGRQEAEALQEMGQPEALVVDLDPGYFDKHVVGNEAAFLRFFVQGAQMFYSSASKRISVPQSLNEHAKASRSTTEAREGVDAFVREKLYVYRGSRVLTKTLYDKFKDFMGDDMDFLTFSVEDFGSELARCLKTRGGEFSTVRKKQGSVNGVKARFWENLAMSGERS